MTEQTEPAARSCRRVGCGREVPESLGTRPREYCSRSCRQRAYEARKLNGLLREAREAALAEAARGATSHDVLATSHDVLPSVGATSRDGRSVPVARAAAPRPAAAAGGDECPYCRRPVAGLVAHLRQCPEGPGTAREDR